MVPPTGHHPSGTDGDRQQTPPPRKVLPPKVKKGVGGHLLRPANLARPTRKVLSTPGTSEHENRFCLSRKRPGAAGRSCATSLSLFTTKVNRRAALEPAKQTVTARVAPRSGEAKVS